MKTGYPYLKIAQKYNIEYADVLIIADHFHKESPYRDGLPPLPIDALNDIVKVRDQHRAITNGDREFSEQYDLAA